MMLLLSFAWCELFEGIHLGLMTPLHPVDPHCYWSSTALEAGAPSFTERRLTERQVHSQGCMVGDAIL
jgi:hypothetical protein